MLIVILICCNFANSAVLIKNPNTTLWSSVTEKLSTLSETVSLSLVLDPVTFTLLSPNKGYKSVLSAPVLNP